MLSWVLAVATASAVSGAGDGDALQQLERVYQQSCAERAYGSYGDLCAEMKREIRAYRRTLAAERSSPKAAPSVSPPDPGVSRPAAAAEASAASPKSTSDPR